MKLVNIHKLIFGLIIFFGWNSLQAQEVWSLKQCVDTARAYNKNLKIQRNNIAIGEQREMEAKANLFPKLSANADYRYYTDLPRQLMPLSTFNPLAPEGQFKEAQFGVPHNINANVQLSMPLYNAQLYGAIQSTKTAAELSELLYQKTEEEVFYEIITLYYNAQILQSQLQFIDSNLANSNTLLKTIQLLQSQLMATGNDVNKVKLQTAQLITKREIAGNNYIQLINALKLAMGLPQDRNIKVENNVQYRDAPAYKSNINLDIRIIRTQNKLLNNELSTLRRSRYLPSVNLVAMYGTTGFGYDKRPNEFLKFYPVGFTGLQLNQPLFNGTVTQRKIKQKQREITNNALQSELLTEKNNLETEDITRKRTVAQKTVQNTQDQITLAESIYKQTLLQHKQGTSSLTDILLADNALREAQQQYLQAIIDFFKADLELKKLTGNIISAIN